MFVLLSVSSPVGIYLLSIFLQIIVCPLKATGAIATMESALTKSLSVYLCLEQLLLIYLMFVTPGYNLE